MMVHLHGHGMCCIVSSSSSRSKLVVTMPVAGNSLAASLGDINCPINLQSTWARKNDGRSNPTLQVENTVFADDAALHGIKQELHESDNVGPCGMDVFSQAVHKWGSSEHQGKRERYTYGSNSDTCLVGGGIGPSTAVNRNILRPALKGSRLSHKQLGRILMAYVYSPLAYSAKTRATRHRDVQRMQSVFNTACRYVCRARLSQMKDRGLNHNDLRSKLGWRQGPWLPQRWSRCLCYGPLFLACLCSLLVGCCGFATVPYFSWMGITGSAWSSWQGLAVQATKHPSKDTSFIFEIEDEVVKIVPQPRKVDSHVKFLANPKPPGATRNLRQVPSPWSKTVMAKKRDRVRLVMWVG